MGEYGGVVRLPKRPVPDFWQIHGHSWFQFQTGPSGFQDGRVDALVRSAFDIEYTGWRNRAMSGARITQPGRHVGGWSRAVTARGVAGRSAPYAPDGGATILCWAWNDAAAMGFQNASARSAVVDTHRAVISRCRASSIWNVTDAARWAFTNWTLQGSGLDLSSGGSTRSISVTTTNNATLTLPADYDGGTVAIAFLLRPGATGGTVTFSGTAGVTGTFYSGGGGQVGTDHAYTVKRITNLTAANAGQTIILTCTSLDASSPIIFLDSAWVESRTPPPVIVCNLHKSIVAASYGYTNAFSTTWSASGTRTESQMDADVDLYNSALQAMVAEFDGMVQIADVNEAINPGGVKGVLAKTSDGIHPNEFGAGPIVDAIVAAKDRMIRPAGSFGETLSFNGPAPRSGQVQVPHPLAYPYHTPEIFNPVYTAAAVPGASGDVWAFPYVITGARETYMNLALEVTTVGTVGATVRWALYDDVDWVGYPQQQVPQSDTTTAAAFTVPIASTGVKDSSGLVGGFGFVADPGLYWIVIKIDGLGTSQQWRLVAGNTMNVPNRIAAGTNPGAYVGLKLTSQGTAALPGTFPAGAIPTVGPAPAIMIKRTK